MIRNVCVLEVKIKIAGSEIGNDMKRVLGWFNRGGNRDRGVDFCRNIVS